MDDHWAMFVMISIYVTSVVWSSSVEIKEPGRNNQQANQQAKLPTPPRMNKPNADVQNAIPSYEDVISSQYEAPEYACDQNNSQNYMIYCQGELLHAFAMFNLSRDSKKFVDKPMKRDPEDILADFKNRFSGSLTTDDREAVRSFIEENFGVESHDIEECSGGTLQDWTEDPEPLISIEDAAMRQFALEIHGMWKKLCRVIKKEVMEHPKRYSIIYVPHEFIVPGGRFREYYYWDSYWIVKGLLASGMHETAKHIIKNFQFLIERHGFIPTGGRVYYLRRSQPPLFIPMVYEYHTATQDDDFLTSAVAAMEIELAFWNQRRTTQIVKDGKNYTIYQYRAETNVPRPEAYREDFLTASRVKPQRKRQLWRDIASVTESGWDFSSRWLANGKTLDTVETSNIAPVDLNAFMCWNMEILGHLHGEIGNSTRRLELNKERAKFVDTFEAVFFDHHEGAWFDFNVKTGERIDDMFPSMAVPLFTECYSSLNNPMMIEVLGTLHRKGLLQFPGGVPSSLKRGTGQQWDYPNGFAPINHMIIEGLRKSNHPIMQQQAFEIASKWINRNYIVYQNEHKMWQKYDVAEVYPRVARGGIYENQAGYGWSNGALLDLMVTYSKRIRVESATERSGRVQNEEVVLKTPTFTTFVKKLLRKLGCWILKCH